MSIRSVSTTLISYTPPKTAMEFIKAEAEKYLLSGNAPVLDSPIHSMQEPETDILMRKYIGQISEQIRSDSDELDQLTQKKIDAIRTHAFAADKIFSGVMFHHNFQTGKK